ncbi:hypothetical protein COOONC_15529, partial [Cooperia oncophora]
MILLGLLATALVARAAEDPCGSAPTEANKIVCRQLHKWDVAARKKATTKLLALPPGVAASGGRAIAAEFAPIASSIYQCVDLQCMCTYLRGNLAPTGECTLPNGQMLKKAIRKEIRMLTDDERERYYEAVRILKQNGEYDRISRIHSQSTKSGGAHSGPAFLPWHREFTKRQDTVSKTCYSSFTWTDLKKDKPFSEFTMPRYEFALRQIDPSLALPYWDSTLESALPRPGDSVLFTTLEELLFIQGQANVKRAVAAQGAPFTQNDINFVHEPEPSRSSACLLFSTT